MVFAEDPRAYFVMRPLVLCVDDDANVLASLARSLQCDFTVRTAQSGAVALSLLNDGAEYAAILADMKMPCMDGLEFLAQASRIAPDTVAAMLTGDGDQDTAVNALNAGTVHRFIKKRVYAKVWGEVLCKLKVLLGIWLWVRGELAASGYHTEAVVFKISKAVGAPLNQLHLPVEAFGDSVVFGEATMAPAHHR